MPLAKANYHYNKGFQRNQYGGDNRRYLLSCKKHKYGKKEIHKHIHYGKCGGVFRFKVTCEHQLRDLAQEKDVYQ